MESKNINEQRFTEDEKVVLKTRLYGEIEGVVLSFDGMRNMYLCDYYTPAAKYVMEYFKETDILARGEG